MRAADPSGALPSVTRLGQVLEQLGDALATLDIDRVQAAEQALGEALAQMARGDRVEAGARPAVAAQLRRAQQSLLRCRRLGASLTDLVRVSLGAGGHHETYDHRGASLAPVHAAVLNVRA